MSKKIFEALKEAFPKAEDNKLQDLANKISAAESSPARSPGLGKTASMAFKSGASAAAAFAQAVGEAAMETDNILNPLQAASQQLREFRQENEEFVRSGMNRTMFDFGQTLESVSNESFRLTGNFRSSARVIGSFRQNFKALGFVSETFRQSLLKTGVALDAAGFSMDDFSGIIDSATFAFNMSEGQINDLSATLIKTSREFAIAPRELTENFQFAQKNFAYTSKRFMDNFLELQKMSRTTGIGFDQLARSFGGNMDEFQGSAKMAGRLNQILGKSMFNSIDLLNKTEAERAQVIRQGILQRFGDRVGELQKFELLAIGKTLNMSADETRRFLRGEPPKAAGDMAELQKKSPAEMKAARLGTELQRTEESVASFRRPFEAAMISLQSEALKAGKKLLGYSDGLDSAVESLSKFGAGIEEVAGMRSEGIAGLRGGDALQAVATIFAGNTALNVATGAADILAKLSAFAGPKGKALGAAFKALGELGDGRKPILPLLSARGAAAAFEDPNSGASAQGDLGFGPNQPSTVVPQQQKTQTPQTTEQGAMAPKQLKSEGPISIAGTVNITVVDSTGTMMAQFSGRSAPETFPSPGSMVG